MLRPSVRLRAVVFDLDGTLLDRRETFRLHLERQIVRHPAVFERDGADQYVRRLLELDENGTLDRDVFFRLAESEFGLTDGSARRLRADFERHFPETCVPMPNVDACLAALRERDMKLGLITNGRELIQGRKIDRLGLRSRFDSIVISESVGHRKPDPRIFRRCLSELDEPASLAAYVGDNPEPDVVGAKRAGMMAVWRRDAFWSVPDAADLAIDDLMEIVSWIDGRAA